MLDESTSPNDSEKLRHCRTSCGFHEGIAGAHLQTGKLKGWRLSSASTPFTNRTAQLSLPFYILQFGLERPLVAWKENHRDLGVTLSAEMPLASENTNTSTCLTEV